MSQNEIVSETNYYPFGLAHKGYNEHVNSTNLGENWKYQGQERTTDMNLNIDEWKYRVSDPALGRFWQIDPLAEDYYYNSTYAFQENKLGLGYELEGLELHRVRGGIEDVQKGVSKVYSEATNVNRQMSISGKQGGINSEISKIERNRNISQGISSIENGAIEITKGGTYVVGDGLDVGGDAVEKAALIMAPFTEGASLAAIPFTEGAQVIGKSMKAAVNLSDGNYSDAAKEAGGILLIKGVNKLSEGAMKATKEAGGNLTKSQTTTHQTVIGGVGEAVEEAGNRIIEKKIEEDD